ncbi:polyprenyl synthetase family protein [Psittacicella hinzii]|uniref:Uncharacterized protein n=1 Tax=Psittacicella hinzii TaxID=2028575 RepID=A0A3A1YUR2_9GAMM|nr:farnesyl diphosphate synthase [Psittacicella hinzii]RIY40184.1 hypothetical protein CKF58_00960 [Psittacicella hinzii]
MSLTDAKVVKDQDQTRLSLNTLSLNELASYVVQEHDLNNKLNSALPLNEFLSIISQAVRSLIDLVLGTDSDPYKQLFGTDRQINSLLALSPETQKIMAGFGANTLRQAMYYSLHSDGKMLRPTLVFIGGLLFNAKIEDLLIAALAIECVHTYSLIHDDLPAMDNDDYRRGKLTNHKVFGEDMAILAGDSLQTLAYSLLSNNQNLTHQAIVKQIQVLSYGAGHYGMCLGQALDILGEDLTIGQMTERGITPEQSARRLNEIHYRKTAFLIRSSILMGVYAGWEQAKHFPQIEDLLSSWSYNLGLTFQVKDDLLDIEGDQAELGKTVGSDLTNHKLTYVSLFGLEQARTKMQNLFKQTLNCIGNVEEHLKTCSADTSLINYHAIEWLQEITSFVVVRRK